MLFTDLSADRLIRALKKAGFVVVTEGKHTGLSDGTHRVTVPRHARLNPYTVRGILKDAEITAERFRRLL